MEPLLHRSGDEAFTIRSLMRAAEEKGWDLDAPISYWDDEHCDRWYVYGAASRDSFIDLVCDPEDDWAFEDEWASGCLRS